MSCLSLCPTRGYGKKCIEFGCHDCSQRNYIKIVTIFTLKFPSHHKMREGVTKF